MVQLRDEETLRKSYEKWTSKAKEMEEIRKWNEAIRRRKMVRMQESD